MGCVLVVVPALQGDSLFAVAARPRFLPPDQPARQFGVRFWGPGCLPLPDSPEVLDTRPMHQEAKFEDVEKHGRRATLVFGGWQNQTRKGILLHQCVRPLGAGATAGAGSKALLHRPYTLCGFL